MARTAAVKEALTIPGPAGQIEGLLESPATRERDVVAVLCHPHPQFQGTMLNKVVHTLARAMNDLGIPAVRFNFRGVGASDGEYGDGIGETEDALCVARWALDRFAGSQLYLVGFSFGGMVACCAALSLQPAQLITVAPAVSRLADLLAGQQPACPWLIVQGEADDVVQSSEIVEWVNALAPGPDLILLPEVGHFFHGNLTTLRATVTSYLTSRWDKQ